MGTIAGVERQVPARAKVLLETGLELMDVGDGWHEVKLHVQDGVIEKAYLTEKIPGGGFGRYDANKLEPEEQRGEL